MKRYLLAGIAALALLSGCSSAPQAKLQASIGTYKAATTGRAYILVLRPQQQPNSINVSVSGPGGYNETLTLQSASARTPSGVWWEFGWDASKTLTSGTYTFSTTLDGQTVQVSVSVDASAVLAQPTVSIGSNPTTKAVQASWTASSGATAYLVRLVNRTTNTVVARNLIAAQSTSFSNLNLNPAHSYAVEVYAASSNISTDPPLVPGQFNLALGESAPFTVTPAP
ncbi:MAG: hypothetical protein N2Z75_00735 [Meiothermus sp.]|uniref:hypothetical protein n=1 Tax=Meiothermus sp. TaxID=1955249 RepID=UPI0025CCD11A|nr:hypothetical protein [Meiothermus sp.]MCS7067369.1 hypothetical protein [Meiothermus sp.]MCX7600447.1 hypothetical protein [Meiothermus sp.]MDW8426779.1 hypothetical protein [Meiothermus sp.]